MTAGAARENYVKAQIMNSYETFRCELQKEDIARNRIRTMSAINRNIRDVQNNLKAIRAHSGYSMDAGMDSRRNLSRPSKSPESVDTESQDVSDQRHEREGGAKTREIIKKFPFWKKYSPMRYPTDCGGVDKQSTTATVNNLKHFIQPVDGQRLVLQSRSYQDVSQVSGDTLAMKGMCIQKPNQNIQERGKSGNVPASNDKDIEHDSDTQVYDNVIMIQKVRLRAKTSRSATHIQEHQRTQTTTKNVPWVSQSGEGTSRIRSSADVPRVTSYKLVLQEKGTQILSQSWTPPSEALQKTKEATSATDTTDNGHPLALVSLCHTGNCNEGRTLLPLTESRVKSAPILSYTSQRQQLDIRRRSSAARYRSVYDNRDVALYAKLPKSERKRILQELISNCNLPFDRGLIEKERQRTLQEKISVFVASLDQPDKAQIDVFSDIKDD